MGVLSHNQKTAAFLTLGCRVNQYESRVLEERLLELGYEIGAFNDRCDVYVINSCAVTEESVRKSRQMVRRAAKKNPDAFIAVCGCASQLEGEAFASLPHVSFVGGTRNKTALVEALKAHEAGEDHPRVCLNEPQGELTPTAISGFDRTRAYVKIQDGCDGKCSYCIIPKVRGGIVLRDENEILCEVKALAEGGCREVVLTGIETAAYGDGLAALIAKIAAIDGIERIRMGSLEPSFLKPAFVDAMAKLPKVCPHFHLSVQNGSDRILAAMRRKYNTKMLLARVRYLREVMPEVNFSADIIVGFPSETEEDFENTCDLVRQIGFLHLHIFTYSKRPGTEAASMADQVPEAVKTDRLHRLTAIAKQEQKKLLDRIVAEGKPLTILAETFSEGLLSGHTEHFVECAVPISEAEISEKKGTFLTVTPRSVVDGKILCE